MKRWPLSFYVALMALAAAAFFAWEAQRARSEHQRAARQALELAAEQEAERARLEAALAAAQARRVSFLSAKSETPAAAVTETTDPERLVAELTRLRLRRGPQRVSDLHEVVYRLRGLAHAQDRAVPAIAAYLAKFEDVEYPLAGEKDAPPEAAEAADTRVDASTAPDAGLSPSGTNSPSGRQLRTNRTDKTGPRAPPANAGASGRRERLQFEFLTPPSLRLGLIDVLAEIATPAAAGALAETLQRTGRGMEVAYLARKLQAIAPDHYRDVALASARELLLHPVALNGTGVFDRQQRPYLYSVFDFYQDTSLPALATQLLVDGAGKLDRQAFSYLNKAIGRDEALPWIYQAFNQLAISNTTDRSRLLQTALPAAGRDPYATAMVRDALRDGLASAEARGSVIQSLAQLPSTGGRGGRGTVDVAAVQARLSFVEQLRSEFPDPTLAKSFDRATRQLNGQLNPTRSTNSPGRKPGR